MVGGINPELPFQYYLEMLKTIQEIRPECCHQSIYRRGDRPFG